MQEKFQEAFGDCKFKQTCLCTKKDSYENISESIFFIFDNGQKMPVRVVSKENPFQLTVKNEQLRNILLIKTDSCLFTDSNSKCDCIICSDQKIFFVEIKSCNSGGRGKSRIKAAEQLKATLELLRLSNIDFSTLKGSALICFKSVEPRIIQASRNTANAIFKHTYGVSLEEGNVIEF